MKTGIVDVGGGMRGIYACGVLDGCLDARLTFDLGIGVSAGSANLASFFAGQRERNKRFYSQYALRKAYMGVGNLVRKRSFIDMDYVYGTLSDSDGEDPLDYSAIRDNPAEFIVVATNAETGEAEYFGKDCIGQDRYDVFKASSAIPGVCRAYTVSGVPCYDGAVSDPVPVRKSLELGCDHVVLLLTKPRDVVRTPEKDERLAKLLRRKHPRIADGLCARASRYNEGVALTKQLEVEGRALIVAPDDTCGVDTLTRDPQAMLALYEKGLRDARRIAEWM